MIHLAIPSMSVRGGGRPYTTPGLGDRIHSALLGYQYGQAHGEPVTLHLTWDKMHNRPDKAASWAEVLALFPPGRVEVRAHPVEGASNAEWLGYLHAQGIPAECYYYADTYGMHAAEERYRIDISAYLRESPRLEPIVDAPECPGRSYATVHWAGGGQAHDRRVIADARRERIEYALASWGLFALPIGAEHGLTLAQTGALIHGAQVHVGIDSGPMHLASLYLPHDRLHVYTAGTRSHHVRRWTSTGAKENLHG